MGMSEEQAHSPPGLPLWRAAERRRAAEGWTKSELVQRAGIGRVSYDRLATQKTKPQARTIRKIAGAIGLDVDEAMRLAGHQTAAAPRPDSGADIIFRDSGGQIVVVQVKHFARNEAARQLDTLRQAAHDAGLSLGDVLVGAGLAEPAELADPIVGEILADPDLPDDVKARFVQRYEQLKADAEAAIRRG
jgi:DNA-binding XRE family transcriptional regulator